MSGTFVYPNKAVLISGITEHGTVQAYAETLGINESSLRRYIKKEGWDKDVKALLRKHLKSTPKPGDDVSREETLEQEVRELRAAAKRERKDEIRKQRVEDAIKNALRDVPAPRRVNLYKLPKTSAETPHHRQMVLWSDWHGGEIVDPDATNHLNEYNWAIMEERIDELVAGMLSHRANSPALTGLDIALLGDMTSGGPHAELRETNEFPTAVQGVKMGHLIGRTIERLVPH